MQSSALPTSSIFSSNWLLRPLQILAWGLLAMVLVKTAWVGDDAKITFRTVDNAVNGYGLRFNISERVQAYTHPLWMFLHIPFQAIWHNPYWATIGLSFFFTLAGLGQIARTWDTKIGWILLPLVVISSKAFVDYSTSGLENPLTHFLLALFVAQWWKGANGKRHLFYLALIAGALLLNRMDTILLVGPALAIAFWRQRPRSIRDLGAVWQVGLGLLPFLVWEAFSLLYYGIPFPNTAYAKLAAGIPQSESWYMGWQYFKDSFARDPVTLPLITLGIIVGLRKQKQWPFAIGMVLYLIYIARIGGDFMSGRFFSAPFLLALWIVGQSVEGKRWLGVVGTVTAFGIGLLGSGPSILSGSNYGKVENIWTNLGIVDERAFYYKGAGMLHAFEGREMPDFEFVNQGKDMAKYGTKFASPGAIGMIGYYGGPDLYILDRFALADPLFARMPCIYTTTHRPGHYMRPMVKGYQYSIEKDGNWIDNPCAWEWYEKMRLLTRAPLFDGNRLTLIWRLNMGISKPCDLTFFRTPTDRVQQLPVSDTTVFEIASNMGVQFTWPQTQHADSFSLDYRRGAAGCVFLGWMVDGEPIDAIRIDKQGYYAYAIPKSVNSVAVYPDSDWLQNVRAVRVW